MLHIRENIPLRDFTTFRAGGPASFFCEVGSEAELAEAISFARGTSRTGKNVGGGKTGVPIFILGGGSNILVSDEGFDGLVILMNIKGVDFGEIVTAGAGEVVATVGAGENWDEFVGECVRRGFVGMENLSGIPGTVGGAPVQNIGAYGAEISQFIQSVRVFDTSENSWRDFSAAECDFEYRDSIFKGAKHKDGTAQYVIVSVAFVLKKFVSKTATPLNLNYKDLIDCGASTPADVRAAVLAIRAKKLPDVRTVGTAGSFFKNPIISAERFNSLKKKYLDMPGFVAGEGVMKVPLAWILDHICEYKGVTKGYVGTYKNQALVIVNNGAATATNIKQFADEITSIVKEKTDIDIEPEVQYVE